ncbi:MAG TPA: PA14 domain-containing protein [Verrucomicrobiae bacterium]|nr:PA14 domain-containing protein [Verrucomicrobiae bacterium]
MLGKPENQFSLAPGALSTVGPGKPIFHHFRSVYLIRRIFTAFFLGVLCWLLSARGTNVPYGLVGRPSFNAFNDGQLPASAPTFSGTWSAVVAFPNLTFLNPMGLLPVPSTSNLVVWEREGRIYQFANDKSTSNKTLVLDISNQTQGWDDSGLMGIAFHPGFATNRYLFIYYTYAIGTVKGSATMRPPTDTPNHDRLERYTLDQNGVTIPGSATVFIDQVSETVWHNGGGMFFHPKNGFLYLTNGDDNRGVNDQRINYSLHSAIIRIDVDQRGGTISHPIPKQPLPAGSSTANYYIPNDNPFVGQPGVLEEFFALGLRSPHRMTIDPPSGRIFIGDVGDISFEELDIIEPNDPPGLNFQWSKIEGKHGNLTPPYIGIDRPPVLDYSHSEGAAIIGGYVYRGREFAADLGGKYIFGDNIANVVWVLDESTTPPSRQLLCTVPRGPGPNAGNDYIGLSSFGYDQDNELYLCQLSSVGGRIFKLARGGTPAAQMPSLLSETGAFKDLASLRPSAGFVHYTVNSPLWSDGALKTRWMGIPDGQKIGFSSTGEWTFPEGSVWLKHFDLPINETNPAVVRRLETRLLVRDTNGYVYGASYKWRPDYSDAEILNGAMTEDIPITLRPQTGPLTSADVGNPAAGSTTVLPDGFEIQGGGADIWGTADQFRWAYEERTGDFDLIARVESLTPTDLYTKAGLMVRDSLAANARHILALVFSSNGGRNDNDGGYEFQFRDAPGGSATAIYPAAPQPLISYPYGWLRLKREGNSFTAYSSGDGELWQAYANKTLALPATIYLGLAVTAHNASGVLATARFHFPATRVQRWSFPSRQDCLSCHTRAAGGVLGVKTRQSNVEILFPETGQTDNQIRALNHVGYFDPAVDESAIGEMLHLVPITNEMASLEFRVRSYLDANCSHCHRPGGVRASWDARIETPLGLANIVAGTVENNLGIPGAQNVAPQDVLHSIMYKRTSTATELYKMPPLAKNTVDKNAVVALAAWINTLAAPPSVTITAPTNGGLAYAPTAVRLSAAASSTNGAITGIQYYSGETKIGESGTPPFSIDWPVDQGGSFDLVAFATDSAGLTGRSRPVTLAVIGAGANGLLAEYFDTIDFNNKKLTRLDSTVDFDWGIGSPDPLIDPDTFTARWTGQLQPAFSETYSIYVTADDGVRFWMTNNLYVDKWIDQGATVYSFTIGLTAGRLYDIKMEMYENGGSAVARLEWSSPSQPRQVIPATALFPPAPPPRAPLVALRVPVAGAAYYQPGKLRLEADASDPDNDLARVEFFADGIKLGQVTASPYVWDWVRPALGTHIITGRATDFGNLALTSLPVTITIAPLAILSPAVRAGRFELQFLANDGTAYRIERSTDLTSWEPAETQTAANGRVTFSEPLQTSGQRFYRVVPLD